MFSCGQAVHSWAARPVDNRVVMHSPFEKSAAGWFFTKLMRATATRFYTYIGGLCATIIGLITGEKPRLSPLSTPLTVTTTCFVNKEGAV